MRAAGFISFCTRVSLVSAGLFWAQPADAVRFTLGLAGDLVPIVFDGAEQTESATRFGLLPVIEFEPIPQLSIGTYTPFTLVRAGGSNISSSSGAESVFGLQISARYPIWRDVAPEEILLYGTLRGGFGTVEARAGPFVGLAVGAAITWLPRGAGLFAELGLGRLVVSELSNEDELDPSGTGVFVDRWFLGLTVGFVFRLGGERWAIEYAPSDRRPPD